MVSSATPATYEEIEYQFLKNLGASDAMAAGWLGNFQVESGFRPTAFNAGEGAIGIAQWEGGRRTRLDSVAGSMHVPESDIGAQLAYLKQEITGPEAQAWADSKKAKTPAEVAAIVDAEFERSAGTTRGLRISDAQTIYGQLQAGTLTGAGLPAGSGASSGSGSNGITGASGPLGGLGSIVGGISEIMPWNLSKDIRGIVTTILAFVLKLAFVAAGLAMILLGVWRTSGTGKPPIPIPEV